MAKRTPQPCTPENCGELYELCGKLSTYCAKGCRCDPCAEEKRLEARRYRVKHLETLQRKDRERYAADPDKKLAMCKKYRTENPEKCSETSRNYRKNNPDRVRAKDKRWKANNPDKDRAHSRKWRQKNREVLRAHAAKRRSLESSATVVRFTAAQLSARMDYYGNKCYLQIYGVCTGNFEHVEHVKPLTKGGAHMLCNLRPVCGPCNRRKYNHWPFPIGGKVA